MFGGSQSVDKLWFYDKLSSFRFRQVNERQQQLTEDGPRVSRGFHLWVTDLPWRIYGWIWRIYSLPNRNLIVCCKVWNLEESFWDGLKKQVANLLGELGMAIHGLRGVFSWPRLNRCANSRSLCHWQPWYSIVDLNHQRSDIKKACYKKIFHKFSISGIWVSKGLLKKNCWFGTKSTKRFWAG